MIPATKTTIREQHIVDTMVIETGPNCEPAKPVILPPVESFFWSIDHDLDGALRVAVLVRMEGTIEASLLAVAFQNLQRRHPKLSALIRHGKTGRWQYEFQQPVPPVRFEIKDIAESETPWREETRQLLEREFPPSGPLIAATVLRNRARGYSELILVTTHAIADGLSAIMLADNLLAEYANAEADNPEPAKPVRPVVIPLRAHSQQGWGSKMRLLQRFWRLQKTSARSGVTHLPDSDNVPQQSEWVHWVFSREETLQLVRACRKQKTSMSGVILAAVICALMDCLPSSQGRFMWQIPFELRDTLQGKLGPIVPQDLGCFSSIMNGFSEVPQHTDFWDLARLVQVEIQSFINRGGPAFSYNISAGLHELKAKIREVAGIRPRKLAHIVNQRPTLLATNYGVIDMQDSYGSLRPKECTLTFRNDRNGPSLVVEALVLGQQLNLAVAGYDLDRAFWEQVHATVRKHVDVAIGAHHSERFAKAAAAGQDNTVPQRMSVAPQE